MLAVATAARATVPQSPRGGRTLGPLEQESVDDALAVLGLQIDPEPAGKVIGHIFVVNQEVFSRDDWYFQLLNVFHRTTRPDFLQRELLVAPGQIYDQSLIDESVRDLQMPPSLVIANRTTFSPPELSSVVALLPVVSPLADTVDLLAVTRDVWSLRFNTNFELQQGTLSLLTTSLSENNLFGWRKYAAVGFDMDQGRFAVGPSYFDPNIAGTRLTLLAQATALYARDTRKYEGDSELFSLRYPLFSLASRWGAGVDVSHQDAVARSFRGNELRRVDLTSTPDVAEDLPYMFRRRILTIDVNVVRSFGRDVVQRLSLGTRFDRRRSLVSSDFPSSTGDELATKFLAEIAPRSEIRSEPYLRYELFTPRYQVFRNLDSFDLSENRRLGPSVTLEIGAGLPALGADFQTYPMSGGASWAVAPGGGYGYVLVQAAARVSAGSFIDQRWVTRAYFASPPVGHVARLVVSAETDVVRADSRRTRYFLGGNTGLRGYAIGDRDGTSQFIAHLEVRSLPMAVFSQRIGAIAFYDVGDADSSFRALVPYQDFGLGLRWLIPQLNSAALRVDWALATRATLATRAGLPGRFTAGFAQTF